MRFLLTRPAGQNEVLAQRLRERGHEVEICPLVAIEPLGDEPIELDSFDWLIVSSANGARELARRGSGKPRRVAAIGPGTAAALRDAGFEVDLVPRVSTQEGLLAELPRPAGDALLAAAEDARLLIVDELGARFLPLYRTRPLRPHALPTADLAVLASASAARAFAALGAPLPAVSIGPQTTAAAREAGVHVVREARTHDLEGLVEACSSPS